MVAHPGCNGRNVCPHGSYKVSHNNDVMKRDARFFGIIFIIALILNASCSQPEPDIAIVNLRCEYQKEPSGINAFSPRLTWGYSETNQNFIQKAYQIGVASNPQLLEERNADIWLSDKISDHFPRAEYSGNQLLPPRGRYYWNVTVWDNKGNSIVSPTSWFEKGKYENSTQYKRIGHFSCSDPILNKIWETTNQWTVEEYPSIDLVLLNMDCITYYEKRMNDFLQRSPSECDASLFIIPHALYNYYGEQRCIQRLYPVMQRYLDYIETNSLITDFNSCIEFYSDYKLMSCFATLLGNDATPYTDKAEQLRNTINEKYYNAHTGLYANATQTAQALPLYLKVVPNGREQLVAENLHRMVVTNNYFPNFEPTASMILPVLTKFGYVNAAYKMASKAEALSDSIFKTIFMSEISKWMYNALAGINFEKAKPGFEHIIIKPHFINELQWVKGEYNSVWGMIESEWKRKENRIELTVRIPAGTTATIYADKEYSVGSGLYTYSWKI